MKFAYAAACVIWAAATGGALAAPAATTAPATAPARTPALAQALEKAGGNRAQLEKALAAVSAPRREGMEFLIVNMPDRDLASLSADFLVENVTLAYETFEKTPWAGQVSKDLFLNEVLPYVNMNERRDNWRKDFATRFGPLVKDCKTITQAAATLNNKIFGELKVRYSTDRPKADQSPYESTAAGKASCTGLSIILVDACRAVGIPARMAGAPLWTDMSGNHTWVEVWDGTWHFTGGGEPSGDKLDGAWFTGRAGQARKDHPLHALYAVSFRKTGTHFPLPWDPMATYVPAVNVTERYAAPASPATAPATNWPAWAQLTEKEKAWAGTPEGQAVAAALERYFSADGANRRNARLEGRWDSLLKDNAPAIRKLAWRAHCGGWDRRQMETDFKAGRVTWETYVSPYTVKTVGKRPANGWPLFIAMHGGGGAPQELNDQQWRVMQIYYRDQPVEGYLYVAIRAPNNIWNGFYDMYNIELTQNLIRQMTVLHEADPNKVYLMGYSHGGYGAFFQGLRIPDRFAAVHASAAAPTEWRPLCRSLRNTVFTAMIGEGDTMYGRLDACRWFDKASRECRGDRTDIYPVRVDFKPGGHGGLPDRDMILPMYQAVRKPVPRHVTWEQSGVRHLNWLSTPKPVDAFVDAVCENNTVTVRGERLSELTLSLDERLVDFARPVTVVANGRTTTHALSPSLRVLCETLNDRGDPEFMFTARVAVAVPVPATQPGTKPATQPK